MPLSPRAVAMLRDLPRRRRWVIDRMDGTAAKANLPANDRHILAYLKTVLAKLGLEGTNHKFRHSFCTIAVLAGVDFFTLRHWVGHIDEEALKIYVHIADEQAQVTMRQLAERRQAAGPAKARPRAEGHQHSFSTVTEVKHDALLKEPWKLAPELGLFDSTIPNQRRGRDSLRRIRL